MNGIDELVTCETGFYDCLKSVVNATDPGALCEIACSGCSLIFSQIIIVVMAVVAYFLAK